MRLLYIGDIMGEVGVKTVESLLPNIKKEHDVDVVIAQAENVTDGKGISAEGFKRLKSIGVDFCTGGNWSTANSSIFPLLEDENQPIIRPANYPSGTPGLGYKYLSTSKGKILVISLLGRIVGKDADSPVDNPLKTIDIILDAEKDTPKIATVVNFHGDYSSEKVVIGHYLDGRVTAVVGDHWHVPTADGRILPKGTAHITDVGMCGSLDSSLGVKLSVIFDRWREGHKTKNELETEGPSQFNAVVVDVNANNELANSIEQIHIIQN